MMGKDIDRGLISLDYRRSCELAISLFGRSTGVYPEAWQQQAAELLMVEVTQFALHARRVLNFLIRQGHAPKDRCFQLQTGPLSGPLNQDCPFTGAELGSIPEEEEWIDFALNRIAHAESVVLQWTSTDRMFGPKSGAASPAIIIAETDYYSFKRISIPSLTYCFLKDVRELVQTKEPWAAINHTTIQYEERSDGIYIVGGKIGIIP
jgi:hypothetical protein